MSINRILFVDYIPIRTVSSGAGGSPDLARKQHNTPHLKPLTFEQLDRPLTPPQDSSVPPPRPPPPNTHNNVQNDGK